MIQINNELRDRAYKCACDHGFHDKEYSDAYWIMLIITEISEAIDADRNGKIITKDDIISYNNLQSERFHKCAYEEYIKGCIGEELSDVIIRCLDFAGLKNLDVNSLKEMGDDSNQNIYNLPIIDFSYYVIGIMYDSEINMDETIIFIISSVFFYCKRHNIDILWQIEQKMKYNEMRPRLNGKKY